jgi:hypothetical protein
VTGVKTPKHHIEETVLMDYKEKWLAFVNTVMNLRVPFLCRKSLKYLRK